MGMQEKTITVRIEPEWKNKIEKMATERIETKSNLIREALIEFIRRETEMMEIKKIVARKFASDEISFEELIKIVGYNEARKIAFYVQTAKKSLVEGLR
jgi:predicted transcriptional regulator